MLTQVTNTGLNFTVSYEAGFSALQEAISGCYVAFDPSTSALIPGYCQQAYADSSANAQVFLDRNPN